MDAYANRLQWACLISCRVRHANSTSYGTGQGEDGPEWVACRRLDLELELGAIVGATSALGDRVSVDQADDMIFGYVLLNDWSARDIQAWEYQPLGPFQSKALGTTIGAWIVTQAALEPFRSMGLNAPMRCFLTFRKSDLDCMISRLAG